MNKKLPMKLASYYREQARKFDEKVRYHEKMGEMYRRNPLPFDGKMAVPIPIFTIKCLDLIRRLQMVSFSR